QGIVGTQGDRGGMVAAVSYLRQEQLTTAERRLSAFGIDERSALGSPGTYFFFGLPDGAGGTLAPTPILDPGCAAAGGIPNVAAPNALGPGLDAGTCDFDFGRYFQIVPDEERVNAFVEANYRLFDNVNWHSEFTYAIADASRLQSPSFPVLTFPTIPADHPNNPFPAALDPFPRAFFGRLIGFEGPSAVQDSNSVTFRASTGVDGKIADTVNYELNYAYSRNDRRFFSTDQLGTRVQLALNGFGGLGCNPLTGTAGQGPCSFFNPFSSNRTTAPNDPALLDWLTADQGYEATADLHVVDLVFSSMLVEGEDYAISAAAGWQYRRAQQTVDWSDQSNDEDFVFILGNQDYEGTIEVSALFMEANVDLFDRVNLQLAGRYEGYFGGFGSTFDPKVAARVKIIDEIAVRGSFSTSFKAPGVFQSFGGGTTLQQIVDPVNNAVAFAAVTSSGNPDLDPEQSVNFNIGTTIRPFKGLNIDFDFWSFEFSDVITQENAQAKVNGDPQNEDFVIRAGGNTGPILRVLTDFVNANKVTTRGIDLTANYQLSTSLGVFVPSLTGTYILQYDINDPNVGDIDGAGKLNFENFGTSTPQLRLNAGLAWLYDEHAINVFVRYIGGYDDVQVRLAAPGGEPPVVGVDAMTTLDAQYRFALDGLFSSTDSLSLTIGGVNLLDAVPPRVAISGGFDSKVHDPRGRTLYAALTIGF
ncbi:MAG: TonB-dependent receptor, partial [Myxococcota bacterium]